MTEWTKHTGTEMPSELAAAQAVEVKGDMGRQTTLAFVVPWYDGLRYRPLLSPDGLPYVSAEGLMIWANYVAVSGDGNPRQYHYEPEWSNKYIAWRPEPVDSPRRPRHPTVSACPPEYAIPGDPEHSLARVWRK